MADDWKSWKRITTMQEETIESLRAALREAEAQRDAARRERDHLYAQRLTEPEKWLREGRKVFEAERGRAEALAAALREYGRHLGNCSGPRDAKLCTCGLSRALAGEPACAACAAMHVLHVGREASSG